MDTYICPRHWAYVVMAFWGGALFLIGLALSEVVLVIGGIVVYLASLHGHTQPPT